MKHILAVILIGIFTSVLFCDLYGQAYQYNSEDTYEGQPKFSLSVGGWLKVNGIYDFVGVPNQSALNLPSIPVGDVDKEPYFSMDMFQSRLKLESVYRMGPIDSIRAYIETDFYGNGGGTMRLRHAYVEFKGFRIGQANTVLTDGDVWPDLIDFDGPVTGIWVRHVQVSYGIELKNQQSLRFSLETPFSNYDRFVEIDSLIETTSQNVPDFILSYRNHWNKGHVQLGGIARWIDYVSDDDDEEVFGYGLALSGSVFQTKRHGIQLQAAYGKGISSYMIGLQGFGFDAAPDEMGELHVLPSMGGYISGHIIYGKRDRLKSTAVIGYAAVQNKLFEDYGDVFEGEFYAINVYYHLMPNFRFGGEVDYGTHEDVFRQTGDAGRILFCMEYSF